MNNNIENPIRVIASRHSAFYTPLLLTVELGLSNSSFMKSISANFYCNYSVANNNENVYEMIANNEIDIAQSSVGGSWNNEFSKDIVHFAEINKMDGFFIVRRDGVSDNEFQWEDLIGSDVIIDHSKQPFFMFKYACYMKNINFNDINVIDAGSPEKMVKAFRNGDGDYIHLQSPESTDLTYTQYDEEEKIIRTKVGESVASVGKVIGPLSFSSLICNKSFLETNAYHKFIEIFHTTKLFSQTEKPLKIAEITNEFFPDTDLEALEKSILEYQNLNCWNGDLNVSENYYDKSLEIFRHNQIEGIFPYSEVVFNSSVHL